MPDSPRSSEGVPTGVPKLLDARTPLQSDGFSATFCSLSMTANANIIKLFASSQMDFTPNGLENVEHGGEIKMK